MYYDQEVAGADGFVQVETGKVADYLCHQIIWESCG